MKKRLQILLVLSLVGAMCGFAFLFVSVFMLGVDLPDMDGRRGAIGTVIEWFNTPLVSLLDWMTRRRIMTSDNLLMGSILYLLYWALLGGTMVLGGYCLVLQLLRRLKP